ncbi:MAG TPA: sigma-70 family RNA polymerase sigma factor [Planctomycetota bacterium]|jgi:RNA polymerase sigma-70 factor (ECF subfamily)|nr:sigma-70 family RNA polymerase sigma factor [Planctomycetota bacterium]
MHGAEPETVDLLRRWHEGDAQALDTLLRRELPWIEQRVRTRLGSALRARAETQDFVQQALLEFLRYGPRFLVADRAQLRALLARIAENVLRGAHDHFAARRRALHRERPLPSDSVLFLDGAAARPQSPSQQLAAAEEEARVRLALELLDPADNEVLVLRDWGDLSHAEIGRRLDISEDAARMRYARAVSRLAVLVQAIAHGRLDQVLSLSQNGESTPAEASP